MTPQQINVAIAAHRGWEFYMISFAFRTWHNAYAPGIAPPSGPDVEVYEVGVEDFGLLPICENVPDYHSDLNLIHEAMNGLPRHQLDRLADLACDFVDDYKGDADAIGLITLDAPKLCEFYLRTVDKWREGE